MITNKSILQAKEEEEAKNEGIRRGLDCSSSSRQWSRLRNPRIVRVPRSFGGKDRHSKVCTVRGLRDRRIRLSVPTALELYHLQDKLGLNQPSKVVDWLLDVTKQDIDKLPPLQMPPGFGQFHQQEQVFGPSRNLIGDLLLNPYESNPYQFPTNTTTSLLSKQGVRMNDGKFWDMKSKQVMMNDIEKGKSVIELQKAVSAAAQSFFPTLPTNAILPYNHHYENSNLLSLQPQAAENYFFNQNSMSMPSSSSSSLALPALGSHHLYLCPPTLPSLFPSYPSYLMPPTNEAAGTRQVNHFQFLNNAAAAAGPSQSNVMNSKYLHHHLHHTKYQAQSSETREGVDN